MRKATYQIDETEILDKTFTFLVQNGLENITVRELCKGTGLVQGTLYYWFGNKNSVLCESTEYGLKKVTDALFRYVYEGTADLRSLFDGFLEEIGKYKEELRFIYQMAASPVYGEELRKKGADLNVVYDRYAHRLAAVLRCNERALRPMVYLFISAVLDYVIWDEREKTQLQLECIYTVLTTHIVAEEDSPRRCPAM